MKKGRENRQKWSKIAPPSVPPPEALYDKQVTMLSKDSNPLIHGIPWTPT